MAIFRKAPRLVSSTPADDAINVPGPKPSITITFDQAIQLGAGDPYVYVTDGAVQTYISRTTGLPTTRIVGATYTEKITITSADFTGNSLTFQVGKPLAQLGNYHVQFGANLVTSTNGANFAGINDSTTVNFEMADYQPQALSARAVTAAGTYAAGATITFEVTFSEIMYVTGAPTLELETGVTDRLAQYVSGNSTNVLKFAYVVQAGDSAAELNFVSTTGLASGLRDYTSNTFQASGIKFTNLDALVAQAGTGSDIVIDGIAPTLTSWSTFDGSTNFDATGNLVLTFSEDIFFGPNKGIFINEGGNGDTLYYSNDPRFAINGNQVSISGFQPGTDYVVSVPNGEVTDSAGNPIAGNQTLSFTSHGPNVTARVASITSSTPNGTYGPGANIDLVVTFSEDVNVNNGTYLLVQIGGDTKQLALDPGGGNTALARYTVGVGDQGTDVIAVSLDDTNSPFFDNDGNAANLTLPAAGAPKALDTVTDLVIDGVAPVYYIMFVDANDDLLFLDMSEDVVWHTGSVRFKDLSTMFTTVLGPGFLSQSGSYITVKIDTLDPNATYEISIDADVAIDAAGNTNVAVIADPGYVLNY